MTLYEYKQWKPIFAALEDGELQEFFDGQWRDCDSIGFAYSAATYRRKPKTAKIYVRLAPNGAISEHSLIQDVRFISKGPTLEFENSAPLREQIKVLREALTQVSEWFHGNRGLSFPITEVEFALKFEP